MKGLLVIGVIGFFVIPTSRLQADGDESLHCVAQIRTMKIATVEKGGRTLERFLRDPKTKQMLPDLQPIGGTGFLVKHNSALYLVTARHVGLHTDRPTELLMYQPDEEPLRFRLGDVVPREGPLQWRHHDTADVSVLPLQVQREVLAEELESRAWPVEMLEGELVAPARGAIVEAIGFPMGLGGGPRFNPISRYSRVATGITDLPTPDGTVPGILLDGATAGGMSGGPVFSPAPHIPGSTLKPEGPKCIGLVSGTHADNTGGKIGGIMPAVYIVELLDGVSEEE